MGGANELPTLPPRPCTPPALVLGEMRSAAAAVARNGVSQRLAAIPWLVRGSGGSQAFRFKRFVACGSEQHPPGEDAERFPAMWRGREGSFASAAAAATGLGAIPVRGGRGARARLFVVCALGAAPPSARAGWIPRGSLQLHGGALKWGLFSGQIRESGIRESGMDSAVPARCAGMGSSLSRL